MNLSSLCRLTIPNYTFYLKDIFILYWHNYMLWMLRWPRSSARTDGLIPLAAGSATRWQPSALSPLQESSWRGGSPYPRLFPLSGVSISCDWSEQGYKGTIPLLKRPLPSLELQLNLCISIFLLSMLPCRFFSSLSSSSPISLLTI